MDEGWLGSESLMSETGAMVRQARRPFGVCADSGEQVQAEALPQRRRCRQSKQEVLYLLQQEQLQEQDKNVQ